MLDLNSAGPIASELAHFFSERQVEQKFQEEILSLSSAQLDTVVGLIRALRPSSNSLREILQTVKEICSRDGVDWSAVFCDNELQKILSKDSNISPKDRQRQLKRVLAKKRYPETERIESEIKANIKNLVRAYGISLDYPKDLEGDSLGVTINFSSPLELEQRIASLSGLAKDRSLERVFEILRGQW